MSESCCENPQLQWESRRIVDRFADVLACANCRRTHKGEDWAISLPLPMPEQCVNCGGDMRVDTSRSRHGLPERVSACASCGLSGKATRKLHRKLARLHPSGEYLQAAEAASDGGRTVLAFKLATAHLAYVEDHPRARILRIRGLEALGLVDGALAEAWQWFDEGAPSDVLGIIAGLEAARGNLEGTVEALERGLQIDPQNIDMWTDYAEIQAHLDDREGALVSAGYGLGDPDLKQRCLEVVATIGERFYAEDRLEAALGAPVRREQRRRVPRGVLGDARRRHRHGVLRLSGLHAVAAGLRRGRHGEGARALLGVGAPWSQRPALGHVVPLRGARVQILAPHRGGRVLRRGRWELVARHPESGRPPARRLGQAA